MMFNLGKLFSAEHPTGNTPLPSPFVYDEDGQGFKLILDSKVTHFQWEDIATVFGYKIDCITYDIICLDLFMDNGQSFSLTELTPGWYEFSQLLADNIAVISPDWVSDLTLPAFVTNQTLLFDKKGRTKEQAETDLYK